MDEQMNQQANQSQPDGQAGSVFPSERQVPTGGRRPSESKAGPIAGIIIIVAVLALGGFYLWGAKLNERIQRPESPSVEEGIVGTPEEIESAPDTAIEELKTQGSSDEIQSIEEDLNATELENLDSELEQIDAELNF